MSKMKFYYCLREAGEEGPGPGDFMGSFVRVRWVVPAARRGWSPANPPPVIAP